MHIESELLIEETTYSIYNICKIHGFRNCESLRAIFAYCIYNTLCKHKCPRPLHFVADLCDVSDKQCIYQLEKQIGPMNFALPIHYVNLICQMLYLPFNFTKKVAYAVSNTYSIKGKHMPDVIVVAVILVLAHRYKKVMALSSNVGNSLVNEILMKISLSHVCSVIQSVTEQNVSSTVTKLNLSWQKKVLVPYETIHGTMLTLSAKENVLLSSDKKQNPSTQYYKFSTSFVSNLTNLYNCPICMKPFSKKISWRRHLNLGKCSKRHKAKHSKFLTFNNI